HPLPTVAATTVFAGKPAPTHRLMVDTRRWLYEARRIRGKPANTGTAGAIPTSISPRHHPD
ncbi:hypothetical protein ACU7AI_15415, partial [Pseudomonas aeruginosa]